MANTTQGLAIALFGAYAGGYTAQLDADIAKSGLGPVAESLIGLQGPLLGLDLSDDSTFIDVVLGNLGVDSTNAAYSAAVAWFEGAVASMGRGAAVAAAVNFLLGDSVDAAYASVATAFAADVAAGATWSATTAGAAEFSVADLRVAAGNPSTGTGFNLTAALAAVDAAAADKKAFLDSLDLDANGKLDTAKAPAGDAVTQANEETAVGTAATTAEGKVATVLTTAISGTKVLKAVAIDANNDGDVLDAGDVNFAGGAVNYDAAGAYAGAASDAIQDSILATKKLVMAADLKTAQDNLAIASAEMAKTTSLVNALDGYKASVDAKAATAKTLASATTALSAAAVTFDGANTTAAAGTNSGSAANLEYSAAITYSAADGKFNGNADITISYNLDNVNDVAPAAEEIAPLFTVSASGVVTLNTSQTTITADEAASLKAALEAYVAALKADTDAAALVEARLDVVATVNLASTDGTAVAGVYQNDATALAGEAEAYYNAKDNVSYLEKAIADLATAEAGVTAARENTTELKNLNDAIKAANKVLTDAGYNVVALEDTAPVGVADSFSATAKDDVFTLSALKTVDVAADAVVINNFGFAGNDVIVATGYTLGGTTGNDAVKEVFVKQVGANTVLTFEESAFGSSATNVETFTVTLTGVLATDVSVSNGYIQLA